MRKSILCLCLSLIGLSANAQEFNERPFIEVSGKAVQEIIPDEIYLSIQVTEQIDDKNEKTIESQEAALRKALGELNIPKENLKVTGSNSHLRSSGWFQSDVAYIFKRYELKVKSAEELQAIIKELSKLQIFSVRLERVDHSQMTQLKKALRIEAIKAAKEKADYLLSAVESAVGNPLIVKEVDDNQTYTGGLPAQYANVNVRGARGNGTVYFIDGVQVSGNIEVPVEFKPILIESTIYVKFAIAGS